MDKIQIFNPAKEFQTTEGPGLISILDIFWLIRLRWFAIAGLLLTLAFSSFHNLVETIPQLLVITAFIAGVNGLIRVVLWLFPAVLHRFAVEILIIPQLIFDLTTLSLLLHYSGGVENPFVMFFAFHMALGAMFLRPRQAWIVCLMGGAIHSLMIWGEFFSLMDHYHLAFAFEDATHPNLYALPAYVTAYFGSFIIMIAGVIYFVQTVSERSRQVEFLRQVHERIALSREKLARMGELTAGVSHAIRNPLHGVKNCLQILMNHAFKTDSTMAEIYELMEEGLTRMERITHRLLSLNHEAPLQLKPTNLNDLIENSLAFLDGRAGGRQISLVLNPGPIPNTMLDTDRFSEVLINLLDNAVDACSNGDRIFISTELNGLETKQIQLRISDTGPGIPPDQIDRVFDPFFSTKAVGEGTGLGLAISRQIVEEHGGQIDLEQTSELGTTFKISLPLVVGMGERKAL